MPHFKDIHGRRWNVTVTIPKLRLIRSELDIDLGNAQTFPGLSWNPIDLINVVYLLCRDQCREREMTDEEFGASISGDAIEEVFEAFSQAYLDFCPGHQAKLLRQLMATAKQAEVITRTEVEARLHQLTSSTFAPSGAESSE